MSRMKRTLLLLSILLIVLPVAAALAQGAIPFGLSADDFRLFGDAIQQTSNASSYRLALSSNLNISGGGVSETIDLTGSGVIIPGAAPAISATLIGTSANIFAYPASFTRDVTLANGTFYNRTTDAASATPAEWANEPAGEMLHNLSRTALLFYDSSALQKLGLNEFLAFFDAITQTDLTPYVTIVRQADAGQQAHFVATLNFQQLFTDPTFIQGLIQQLIASGTDMTGTDNSTAGLLVGLLFNGANLTTDFYVGADNHVQKLTANLSLPIDAALVNGAGTPKITVALNMEFTLSDFNQPLSVTTPDGIVVNAVVQPPATGPQVVNIPGQQPVKTLFPTEPLLLQLIGPFDLVYTATVPETISVYVHSLPSNNEPLDTTLEVLDPSGKQIAFNDDLTGDTRDAGVENLFLPAPGTYKIKLNTFDLLDGGGVSVELISANSPDVRNPNAGALLDVPGTLDGANPSNFTFDGEAGQVVTIKVQAINPVSPDLDLNMTLYGPDNTELISDDDTGGSNGLGERDPALMHFQLPQTGQYRIEVTSWFDTPGDISVKVEPG